MIRVVSLCDYCSASRHTTLSALDDLRLNVVFYSLLAVAFSAVLFEALGLMSPGSGVDD